MPEAVVEIAFTSGYATAIADMTWTDVSEYVEGQESISISRGRQDEFSETQPSELSLTLDNSDGRFTPGYEAGAYWPNVKKGRPIRASVVHDGVAYERFFGYINEWPVEWPSGGDEESRVRITASSRMARVVRTMHSVIEEEYLVPRPLAYYTLGEDQDATLAVDSSGNQAPSLAQAGAGDDVIFADATGPGTDEISAPTFLAGKYLSSTSTLDIPAGSGLTIAGTFLTGTAAGTVVELAGLPTVVSVDASGKLEFTGVLMSSSAVTDSETHLFVVVIDSASTETSLYVDGVLEASITTGTPASSGTATVKIGEGFAGTISHVAVWNEALSPSDHALMWTAVDTGFAGETPGEAIERYARYAMIPSAEVVADAGATDALVFVPTRGRTPLDAMRTVEMTEYGSLFDARDGTLQFRGRDHRFGSSSQFTLSAAAQHVGPNLAPTLDDQGMANIIDAARAEEGAPVVHATNQESVDEYGPYPAVLHLATADDNEVADAATWRISRYGEPAIRIPAVEVEIVNVDEITAAALLTADIGTRFTLADLPQQAPWESIDLFIEGTRERITPTAHTLSMNTSTTDLYDSWQLGVDEHGELGRATVLGY